ncbi:MAG: S-adenosyl-l-methionine hydroxide adenosyltransferase family protein [bacterium]
MAERAIITLTTDFGTQDGFVGAMKGVILSINPQAVVVDITHEIEAQDVMGAAFVLSHSCRSFPEGTVHIAVVDPGVGSARRPILLQTKRYFFVGPDNGLFSFVSDLDDTVRAIELTEPKYFLSPVSDTFHGRDIFAPVAAYLSLGVDPDELGPELKDYQRIPFPEPAVSEEGIEGQVVHIDRFGNLITNIDRRIFNDVVGEGRVRIELGPVRVEGVSHSYSEVGEGSPLAIFGSSGYLEISVNRGSAWQRLRLKRGDPVQVVQM